MLVAPFVYFWAGGGLKILLVSMRHDYGDASRGDSYDYCNVYQPLLDLGHKVTFFDYMAELKELGRNEMNRKLLATVEQIRPRLSWFSLYTDQFDPDIIEKLRAWTTTLCFFYDDTWRVDYTRFWMRHFDFFTTPDVNGEKKYAALNLPNAIHFPFGCNERLYCKMDVPKKYDVSFVGGWHPYREWIIKRLCRAGILVEVAGHGWRRGTLSHHDMVTLFNESRINLNLSNSASWDVRYLTSSFRAMANRIRSSKTIEQLKARHFEINSCGTFQLSFYVEGLEQYYEIGREIAIYTNPEDLLIQIRRYLKNDEQRELIARAGHQRTLAEHTFAHRLQRAFLRMGIIDG